MFGAVGTGYVVCGVTEGADKNHYTAVTPRVHDRSGGDPLVVQEITVFVHYNMRTEGGRLEMYETADAGIYHHPYRVGGNAALRRTCTRREQHTAQSY